MAGRPRLYGSGAEKTAAYRARQERRLVVRERASQEYLEADMERLRQAVFAAATAGDGLARSLRTGMWMDLLQDLAAHFEARSREGG
jgi:hypothetical protein